MRDERRGLKIRGDENFINFATEKLKKLKVNDDLKSSDIWWYHTNFFKEILSFYPFFNYF